MAMLDPQDRSARGAALQAKIYGAAPAEPRTPWQESVRDFVYAECWSRPGLDLRTRLLIALAGSALFAFPQETIDGVVKGALITGELTLGELREVALHLSVYGGWGRGGLIDSAATRVAAELGLPPAECAPIRAAPWDPEERTRQGMAEFVNVMTFSGGPSVTPYLEGINNFVFGEMWCRYGGLDQRSRRWLTLVGVCESTAEVPMKSHIHAAMASGNCQPSELQEFVLAFGLCAGWPRASVVQSIVFEQIRNIENGWPWSGEPARTPGGAA
ncbi:MAG: carboxymuconolactone decarboxylase family protein [Sphingomonadales bacterium]|nr:carboxymuconolactone decarboxylase family protein [Sphingomonadales bacterium]